MAENTAVKEEKKTVTLTVAECSEFHNMGEFHENITSVAEAVAKFREIPPERMHGIPAIGIRVADSKNPEDSVEMDVLIGKRIDLDMLRYVPDIAENWQAQQMIAALIHDMPEAQIEGEIPENIQKKIDWIESRDKRSDELHQITDKLEKGVKDVFQSDKYKQFLNVMAKLSDIFNISVDELIGKKNILLEKINKTESNSNLIITMKVNLFPLEKEEFVITKVKSVIILKIMVEYV